MLSASPAARRLPRPIAAAPALPLSLALVALVATACAHPSASTGGVSPSPSPMSNMSTMAPNPDPRVGLKGGLWDAAEAAWNLRLVSSTRPTEQFVGKTNSDIAFIGPYVIQGSYNGFQIWDISDPAHPTLKTAYICPASQSDVSVYKNLLFVSAEAPSARLDCGDGGGQGHGQPGAAPRHPHLRHQRHRAPERRRQRADLPWVAHPHAGRRPEGPGQRLHLHLGLVARAVPERALRAA